MSTVLICLHCCCPVNNSPSSLVASDEVQEARPYFQGLCFHCAKTLVSEKDRSRLETESNPVSAAASRRGSAIAALPGASAGLAAALGADCGGRPGGLRAFCKSFQVSCEALSLLKSSWFPVGLSGWTRLATALKARSIA